MRRAPRRTACCSRVTSSRTSAARPIKSWDQAVAIIENSAGKTLSVTIRRNGVDQAVSLTPVENVKYVNDTSNKTKTAGYLGVSSAVHSYYAAVPATQIPGQIVSQFALGLHALGSYPNKIGSLWDTVFEGKKRDPAGAIGVVGIGRLGGQIADSHKLDIQDKVFFLVGLLATVNLLLFFFNLLPLLPLDGGHVAGALVEAAKRGRARMRARSRGRRRRHRRRPASGNVRRSTSTPRRCCRSCMPSRPY